MLRSDAGLFDKAKACQRLAVIGGRDAVPALAAFLGDKELAHYARFGLEPNPDPAVDVHWGEQTWEEMQFTAITMTLGGAEARPTGGQE